MSEKPPALPSHVSSNGAELWDWAARLGNFVHRQARRRELAEDIRNAQRKCGSCRAWMTRSCPKERNVNGYLRGPSVNALICARFEMKPSTGGLIAEWRDELAVVDQQSPEDPHHVQR